MKRPIKNRDRAWRVSLVKKKAEHLGILHAPDREAAEAAAVAEFSLNDERRKRIVLQEQP
jgi:hypothetical protein